MRTSSQLPVDAPATLTMRSPGWTPAAAAGVPASTFSTTVLVTLSPWESPTA